MSSDQIQKVTVLKAPRERVWKAVSEAKRFGAWFGVDFEGEFKPGAHMQGKMHAKLLIPEIAKKREAYAGKHFEIWVESIEPMDRITFRWHPYAIDPNVDYSSEPKTTIVFELADAPGGTKLTITERGFDSIPLHRRVDAFQANSGGWEAVVKLVEKYMEQ